MDGRIPSSSRVISPLQFSSMTGMANGLDFGSTNLFPSLPPVEDSTVSGMDGLQLSSVTERKSYKDVESDLQDDKAVKVLIEAAKVVLRQYGPLHMKDLIARIQEKGYANSSVKHLESLELILKNEAEKSRSEIRQCQTHWFTIKGNGSDIDGVENQAANTQLPGRSVHAVGKEANDIKYKKKYRGLKKLMKRLIFENAAIADEITETDVKFQRGKVERKFLLKQLLEYQSMCHEPVQPVKIPPPLPDVSVHPPASQPPVIDPPVKPKTAKVRVRKANSGKAKKHVDNSAPTKVTSEEKNDDEATTLLQDGQSEPTSKRKRKKPGTAIKRRVQPIPVDSKGKPVFPIILGGLTVHSLGDIVWDRPGFHSERYIWPVGFCSSRFYPSMKTPDKKCIYTCKILDGGYGPTFVMSPEDDSESSIEASSATACHCVVLKAINKARGKEATNTGSGPEFFGFSHPTIQYLLQSLPNARKCSKYQWVKFELPKGKLGSQVVATDEPMDVSDQQDQASTSFDADEIFNDDSMDESSSGTMHTLTLTSAAPNISHPSPGFERGMLGYQLKSTSGDPSLDLGTPISPPQSSLSSPLQLSPKINTNALSPSAASQPTFLIPPSSPLFGFEDTPVLPD